MDVLIGSPLPPRLAAEIAAIDPSVDVHYEPELLPPERWSNDHAGDPGFVRDAEGERRWAELLAQAEVLYGIPKGTARGVAEVVAGAPRLRWIAATMAGAGELLREVALPDGLVVTRATGA